MATEIFDAGTLKKMRADFLTLLKNAEKVSDYKQARIFADAVLKFRAYLESMIYDGLLGALRAGESRDGAEWDNKIRAETWGLISGLRAPLEFVGSPSQMKYDPGATPEGYFARYKQDAKKWADRLKREARKAWAVLEDYVTRIAKSVIVKRASDERMTFEGIPVTLRGFAQKRSESEDGDLLNLFKVELKRYAERAKRTAPWLLKAQLPIVLRFQCDLDEGGEYHGDHIEICASRWNAGVMAKTIAHEMGHHLWRAKLSGADTTYWEAAIRADYGELDLKELLKIWPVGESSLWFYENRALMQRDPVLYLQINSVLFPASPGESEPFGDREELAAKIDRRARNGEALTVPVPTNPITVYATKNPEEAFCEAFGSVVALGPRAVPPLVRRWLKMILPNLLVENVGPLAGYIDELRGLL